MEKMYSFGEVHVIKRQYFGLVIQHVPPLIYDIKYLPYVFCLFKVTIFKHTYCRRILLSWGVQVFPHIHVIPSVTLIAILCYFETESIESLHLVDCCNLPLDSYHCIDE